MEFATQQYRELLRTETGILMAVAPRDAYQDAVLAMPLAKQTSDGAIPNTDWPIRRSFPVFIFNALEYFRRCGVNGQCQDDRPGQPAVLSLANRYEKLRVTGPAGRSQTMERAGQPNLIYTQTDDLGFYQTKPAESGSDRLCSCSQSTSSANRRAIWPRRTDVAIGAVTVAANQIQKDIVRIEFWRWLLAIAP